MWRFAYYWYKLMRYFNDGEPTQAEVSYCLDGSWYKYTQTIYTVMEYRAEGFTLEQLSMATGWTRERCRQLIRKGVAIHWRQLPSDFISRQLPKQ